MIEPYFAQYIDAIPSMIVGVIFFILLVCFSNREIATKEVNEK